MQDDDKKNEDQIPATVTEELSAEPEEVTMVSPDELAKEAVQDSAGEEAIEAEEAQGDSDVVGGEPVSDEPAVDETTNEPTVEAVVESGQNKGGNDASTSSADMTDGEDVSDDNPNARWYVVHTYSGHENKVANALKQKVASEHLEGFILDVLVPTQDKIEIRGGKKEAVKEKIFPGYILVKLVLDDNSWLAVRTTPGVTSFVGIGNKPTPIPNSEVRTIVKFMSQGAAPTFKDVYMVNDTVKIIEGPFAQFIGKVDTVDKDRGKVRVLVSIFGRETPVELDFLQVQKL